MNSPAAPSPYRRRDGFSRIIRVQSEEAAHDAAALFREEVAERGKLAQNAKRKGHKKLLRHQSINKEEPPVTWHLQKPIAWRGFKALPPDIQREYVSGLVQKFSVNYLALAHLFGCSNNTVSGFFKRTGLDTLMPANIQAHRAYALAFKRWVAGEPDEVATLPTTPDPIPEPTPVVVLAEPPAPETHNLRMPPDVRNCTMVVRGPWQPGMVLHPLESMVALGTPVQIRLEMEVITDENRS
jgi:hypothetical protein